ncbi:MAG TPA: adenylate/guanylate cyclase domain-containing protein [Candidatus Bathyarchaeia archaeon]|nr:adenylate/guanylate cyclase domain-containing protein [Candidatus Bathyarchaeia archaeon]
MSRVLDPVTLRFVEPSAEHAYQHEAAVAVRTESSFGSLAAAGIWLIAGTLIPLTGVLDPAVSTPVVALMVVANLAAGLLARRAASLDRLHVLGGSLNVASGVAVIALVAEGRGDLFERYATPALMLQLIFAFVVVRRFIATIVVIAIEVGLLAAVAVQRGEPQSYILDLFIVTSAAVVGVGVTWLLETAARTEWYQRRLIAAQSAEIEREKAKSDRVLRNVLPEPIADRLREREGTIADGVDDATVLFADLVGFTPLSEGLAPDEVVRALDGLFARFDDLTEGLGVEKIKTIGDAYMAAGGAVAPLPDHAARVVRLGLAMLGATADHAKDGGLPLHLRVGAHSGPLVAGVIGRRRLAWDLWGDTVNTASRMESHGVADAVQISRATLDRLGPDLAGFAIEPRGTIEVKGKGPLEVFLVRAAGKPAAAPARRPGADSPTITT